MRTFLQLFAVACLVLITGLSHAQDLPVKTKPRTIKTDKPVLPPTEVAPVKIDPKVTLEKAPVLVQLPDLIVESFEITGTGSVTDGKKAFTYRAVIRNTGTVDAAGPFWMGIEVQSPESGQFYKVADQRFEHLGPGQGHTVSKIILVPVSYVSGQATVARAFVDNGGDAEFPPANRHVTESDENNNYSVLMTLGGDYMPSVANIHPQEVVNRVNHEASGEIVYLAGQGFGHNEGNRYTVALFPYDSPTAPVAAEVTGWSSGVVYFTVPESAPPGNYGVAIVDRQTMVAASNFKFIRVLRRAEIPWSDVTDMWDLFREAFQIRLHNWAGNASDTVNASTVNLGLAGQALAVDKIQFSQATGDYRYFVNDFNTLPSGITLHRLTYGNEYVLPGNMLRMQAAFESQGFEAKGYWDALGGGRDWQDWGAPDVDFDNAMLGFTFRFAWQNGKLDYTVSDVYFRADVDAHNAGADFALDLFLQNWDDMVKSKVEDAVLAALMEEETRTSVSSSLLDVMNMLAGIGGDDTIVRMDFDDGIRIEYY